MSEELHQRAEQLKLAWRAEGISADDRRWLEAHWETCPSCAERARSLDAAIQSLRTVSVPLNPELLRKTRAKVHAHAEVLKRRKGRWVFWSTCGVTWAWIAVSSVYLWRGFDYLAAEFGVPNWIWQMGFGLWWALPLLLAGFAMKEFLFGSSRERNLTAAIR